MFCGSATPPAKKLIRTELLLQATHPIHPLPSHPSTRLKETKLKFMRPTRWVSKMAPKFKARTAQQEMDREREEKKVGGRGEKPLSGWTLLRFVAHRRLLLLLLQLRAGFGYENVCCCCNFIANCLATIFWPCQMQSMSSSPATTATTTTKRATTFIGHKTKCCCSAARASRPTRIERQRGRAGKDHRSPLKWQLAFW